MAPSKDRKQFFCFDMPMSAADREDTLLGVAFEKPAEGTLAGYTPQGPQMVKKETESAPPSTWDNLSQNSLHLKSSSGPSEPQVIPPATTTMDPKTDQPFGRYDYRSSCPWPKDLIKKVYPNESTDAAGVERITQRLLDADLKTRIVGAITQVLGCNKDDLDTMIIPILRRYSTEDPWGMIRDLLHQTEYRERFINLCSLKQTSSRKLLYVATGLIACEGVSVDRMHQDEKELSGAISDPTHTVPLRIGGKLHHLKRSTIKGGYQSPVVLCMSYHKVEYECIDRKTGIWDKIRGIRHESKSSDVDTLKFDRKDGKRDVFWVRDRDHKGNIPAFMGPDDLLEDDQIDGSELGIFEDADLWDSAAGAEESEDEHCAVVYTKVES